MFMSLNSMSTSFRRQVGLTDVLCKRPTTLSCGCCGNDQEANLYPKALCGKGKFISLRKVKSSRKWSWQVGGGEMKQESSTAQRADNRSG